MKITFTQDEVKAIVLEYVWNTYPQAQLNTVDLDKYAHFEYMVLSFKEPVVPVSQPEVVVPAMEPLE